MYDQKRKRSAACEKPRQTEPENSALAVAEDS